MSKTKEYNLRIPFGPRPKRNWWSCDYVNVELMIWAYSCGNREMIECFENDISVHLLIAQELHGPKVDKGSDAYKRTKNGDFALIYGATPYKANTTYKVKNAYDKIVSRFPEIKQFSYQKSEECKLNKKLTGRHGLHTLGGYFLFVPEHEPHKAVNYFVQGSAGYIMNLAMCDWEDYIDDHPELDMHTILQVHDDLTTDVPEETSLEHLDAKIEIMERQGRKFGVPTKVSAEIITHSWAEGIEYDKSN